MKLWKVTVNNWGWDKPRTLYLPSRADAERAAKRYPAADPVQYAGNFTAAHAYELTHDDN